MRNEDWIKDIPEQNQLGQSILAIFIAAIDLKRRSKNDWRFHFRAAGQDAIATAVRMNIHAHNAATEASRFPIPVAPLAGGSMMTAELRLHPLSAKMLQNYRSTGIESCRNFCSDAACMNVDAHHASHKPSTPQAVNILMQQGSDKEGIMNWNLGVCASASQNLIG